MWIVAFIYTINKYTYFYAFAITCCILLRAVLLQYFLRVSLQIGFMKKKIVPDWIKNEKLIITWKG